MSDSLDRTSRIEADAAARVQSVKVGERRRRTMWIALASVLAVGYLIGELFFARQIEAFLGRWLVHEHLQPELDVVPVSTQGLVTHMLASQAGFQCPTGCAPSGLCASIAKDASVWIRFDCTPEGLDALVAATDTWTDKASHWGLEADTCFDFNRVLRTSTFEQYRTFQGSKSEGYCSMTFVVLRDTITQKQTAYLFYVPSVNEDEAAISALFP